MITLLQRILNVGQHTQQFNGYAGEEIPDRMKDLAAMSSCSWTCDPWHPGTSTTSFSTRACNSDLRQPVLSLCTLVFLSARFENLCEFVYLTFWPAFLINLAMGLFLKCIYSCWKKLPSMIWQLNAIRTTTKKRTTRLCPSSFLLFRIPKQERRTSSSSFLRWVVQNKWAAPSF